MKIRIPSVLQSYTNKIKYVEGRGTTLLEVLNNLDKDFPGIKFRFIDELDQIREHMKIFINNEMINDLTVTVKENDEIFITQALSGG